MGRHVFNFEGGDDLTTMGATWFVSHCYYNHIDRNHRNWENVSTASSRASVYSRTNHYHKFWLNEILKMSDANLSKNSLHLNASEVKRMARELLKKM